MSIQEIIAELKDKLHRMSMVDVHNLTIKNLVRLMRELERELSKDTEILVHEWRCNSCQTVNERESDRHRCYQCGEYISTKDFKKKISNRTE